MRISKNGTAMKVDPILEGIAKNLRKFGYTDVTIETVRSALADNEEGIIGMMARGMLEDNGLTLEET